MLKLVNVDTSSNGDYEYPNRELVIIDQWRSKKNYTEAMVEQFSKAAFTKHLR